MNNGAGAVQATGEGGMSEEFDKACSTVAREKHDLKRKLEEAINRAIAEVGGRMPFEMSIWVSGHEVTGIDDVNRMFVHDVRVDLELADFR